MSYRHTNEADNPTLLIDPPPTGLRLSVNQLVDYQDKYRGAMLGTGIGDALGRAAEGRSPARIKEKYGTIDSFIPWYGWVSGPTGTFTDDTELALCIAESIVECGRLDPQDLADRFAAWVRVGRGVGSATRAACRRLQTGAAWYESGSASAGNGAAMRAAPLGLAEPFDVDELRRVSAWSAVITHADPTAVLSTVVMAFTVAYLLHTPPGDLDPGHLLNALHGATQGLDDPVLPERARTSSTSLLDRIDEVFEIRAEPLEDIYALTHNGAFVTESLPAAIGAFLASPEDPELVIINAVRGGYDADTVAAMAGALAGAYHGMSAFPSRWVDELEFRSGLAGLADELATRQGLEPLSAPLPAEPDPIRFAPFEKDGHRWLTRAHRAAANSVPQDQQDVVGLQPHPESALRLAERFTT